MKNIFRSTLNGQGIDNVAERFMSAVTLGVIPDFLVTSLNMCCLQHSLVLADSSLGSLDHEILRKKSAPRQETPLSN